MRMVAGVVGGLVIGAVVGVAVGYGVRGKVRVVDQGSGRPLAAAGADADAVLMELDGVQYKESDLPSSVQSRIYEAKNEAYQRVDGVLGQFGLELALAKAKDPGAKPDALPPLEQLLDVPTPKEEELKAFFEANKSRLPPDATYEQTKAEIEKYLKNQKIGEELRAKSEELKARKRLVLRTSPPSAPTVQLDITPFAAKGAGAATVVEVADYLCPHCQATQLEVEEALKEIGGKLKFVAVPFSLRPSGLSGTLARGAFCARQQGDDKFWSYHEKAFATAKAKGWKAADPDDKAPVLEVAAVAGLDNAKLEACLASPEAQAFLKSTVEASVRAGVTGTPTFFVNGRKLPVAAGKSLKDRIVEAIGSASH